MAQLNTNKTKMDKWPDWRIQLVYLFFYVQSGNICKTDFYYLDILWNK